MLFYKLNIIKNKNYLKLLKLKKMVNVKVKKESILNGGGMVLGIIIVVCVFVGWLIWKFVMGVFVNFEGGNVEIGYLLNILGMVYKGGFIVLILLGMFLMVVVFFIERFFVILKVVGKVNLDVFMKNV